MIGWLVAASAALAAVSLFLVSSLGVPERVEWFLIAAALGLFVLACCAVRRASAFGLVAAAIMLGGAAELWLTQPLWFPSLHLRPDGPADIFMFALLALEAALAVWILLTKAGRPGLASLHATLGLRRVALAVVVSGLMAVSVMGFVGEGRPVAYAVNLVASGGVMVIHLLAVLALATVRVPQIVLERPAATPLLLALCALGGSLLMAALAFDRVPHVEDEVVYLLQAKLLAEGHLTAPAPPEAARAALDYYLMDVQGDRWVFVTSPAWPAALAAGVIAGAPWMVNPVLAALSVLLAHSVAARLWDRARADVIAVLMAVSPWLMGISGSLMTHTLNLFLMLFAWWCIARWPARSVGALVAGLAMGLLFFNRPLEGVLVGGLTGLWLLRDGLRPAVLAYALGCVATGLSFFAYNATITGDPFSTPLGLYLTEHWGPGYNAFGFGEEIGPPSGWGALDLWRGHGPLEGAINTAQGLAMLDMELLGWGIGSLLPLVAFLIWARKTTADRAMLILAVAVIAAHFFYWFTGSYYVGPRYWFAAFFPFIALSAGGLVDMGRRFGSVRVGWVVAVLCVFSLCVFAPWRGVTKYSGYGNFGDMLRKSAAQVEGNALVLVDTRRNIGTAYVLNDPLLRPDLPIFVKDQGAEANAAVIAAFPGRRVLRYSEE